MNWWCPSAAKPTSRAQLFALQGTLLALLNGAVVLALTRGGGGGGVARDVGLAALGHHQFTALAGLVGVQNLAGGRVFAADGLRAGHSRQQREQRNEGKAVHGGLRFGARATAPVFIIVVV